MTKKATRPVPIDTRRPPGPAGHPSAEQLVAYRAGADREAVRDHLALCRECAAIILDLAGRHRDDAELDAAWERAALLPPLFSSCSLTKLAGIDLPTPDAA